MTDRELLELAAKAAGYEVVWADGPNHDPVQVGEDFGACEVWNPLTDDGDALRLAVKMGMVVDVRYTDPAAVKYNEVCFWPIGLGGCPWQRMQFDDAETDPLAATRRAIVRAAAEIGRTM